MIYLRLPLLLLVLLGMYGCATGVMTGSGQGGYGQDDDRHAEQRQRDQAITAAVNRLLVQDPAIPAMDLRVDTYHGVVTLGGRLPSHGLAQKAVGLARSVPGVRAVKNRITVLP